MKNLSLFVVAAIATVAFASCGGGADKPAVDSTVVVVDTVVKVDTVAVVDTTVKADSVK